MTEEQQCTKIKADGTRCKGMKQNGNDTCRMHLPGVAQELAKKSHEAEKKRKSELRMRPEIDPSKLKTAEDVKNFLAQVMSEVYAGKLSAYVGSTLTSMAAAQLRAITAAELPAPSAPAPQAKDENGAPAEQEPKMLYKGHSFTDEQFNELTKKMVPKPVVADLRPVEDR